MEPAVKSFLAARDSPPPPTNTAHVVDGQGPAQPGWAGRAFQLTLIFLLACAFAWGLLLAGCDLGFAVSTAYCLAALGFCLWKLEQLRRDPGGDPAVAARERRRLRLLAWAITLMLGSSGALQVASVARGLALTVVLWVLAGLAMGLGLYLLFAALRGGARADDDGHLPEKDREELSPEQSV